MWKEVVSTEFWGRGEVTGKKKKIRIVDDVMTVSILVG